MNRPFLVILSLALAFGVVFGADQAPQKSSDQKQKFQVTAVFSEAENVVEELTGTPVADPDSQAKLQKAREVFQKALAQFPDTPLALNFLARTYAFPGQDQALAISTFEKSLAIDPDQADPIVRLVGLYLDKGQRDKAAQTKARLVNATANPDLAAKVDGLIAQWDGAEGQRLVREGHADEGFALLAKAVKETSDPAIQRDLGQMRDAVAREWEITQYNTALERVKAKDYRGAWNILEKLLPVAKDPEVVGRAKRLHDKLEPVIHQPSTD
jgi:tetratricopeptide (TPR) repeat protein